MHNQIPNILTLLRIAIVPIMVICFYIKSPVSHFFATILFAIASLTDFFDGYLARLWKTQSSFGRLLDPIADKLLVITTLVILVDFDRAHLIPSLAIICREVFVSGLREFLAEIRVSVPVSRLAKVKTGFQMAALLILLIGTGANKDLMEWTYYLGNLALWISAVLTLMTGYIYAKSGFSHLDEKP